LGLFLALLSTPRVATTTNAHHRDHRISRTRISIPTLPPTHPPLQAGYRTYKTLPRQTFGTLQSRLTPLYFSFTTLSTATLLLTHLWFHPSLISSPTVKPHWLTSEEGRQGLCILAALVPQAINWLFVGPKTTEVMFERHRLERLESKEYDEPNVSGSGDMQGLALCNDERGLGSLRSLGIVCIASHLSEKPDLIFGEEVIVLLREGVIRPFPRGSDLRV
jgi:hypothetical protein